MHHPTDRITHTTAFGTPVVEHWLEWEIAQWVHPMKDRSDDPLHHERTLYLWATSRSPYKSLSHKTCVFATRVCCDDKQLQSLWPLTRCSVISAPSPPASGAAATMLSRIRWRVALRRLFTDLSLDTLYNQNHSVNEQIINIFKKTGSLEMFLKSRWTNYILKSSGILCFEINSVVLNLISWHLNCTLATHKQQLFTILKFIFHGTIKSDVTKAPRHAVFWHCCHIINKTQDIYTERV